MILLIYICIFIVLAFLVHLIRIYEEKLSKVLLITGKIIINLSIIVMTAFCLLKCVEVQNMLQAFFIILMPVVFYRVYRYGRNTNGMRNDYRDTY